MLGIVQAFDAGTLPVAKNANLVKFLCALLQCKLDRLHKKFKSGKRDGFRRVLASLSGEMLSTAVMEHQASQRRLSKLEEAYALSLTPDARRSGLIAIQTAWREKLLAFCRELRVELDGAETALTPAIVSGDGGVFGDAHKRPRLDFGAGLAGGGAGLEGAAAPDAAGPAQPPAIDDMAETSDLQSAVMRVLEENQFSFEAAEIWTASELLPSSGSSASLSSDGGQGGGGSPRRTGLVSGGECVTAPELHGWKDSSRALGMCFSGDDLHGRVLASSSSEWLDTETGLLDPRFFRRAEAAEAATTARARARRRARAARARAPTRDARARAPGSKPMLSAPRARSRARFALASQVRAQHSARAAHQRARPPARPRVLLARDVPASRGASIKTTLVADLSKAITRSLARGKRIAVEMFAEVTMTDPPPSRRSRRSGRSTTTITTTSIETTSSPCRRERPVPPRLRAVRTSLLVDTPALAGILVHIQIQDLTDGRRRPRAWHARTAAHRLSANGPRGGARDI